MVLYMACSQAHGPVGGDLLSHRITIAIFHQNAYQFVFCTYETLKKWILKDFFVTLLRFFLIE